MHVIISGYSGIGKTEASTWFDYDKFKVVEVESSDYSKDDKWPKNYVDNIIDIYNKYDDVVVLCSCHEEVRMELEKRGVGFVIIAPNETLVYEYCQRWFKRGSSIPFIRKMQKEWMSMHQSLHKHKADNIVVIYLDSHQYLSDLLGGNRIPYEEDDMDDYYLDQLDYENNKA